jgi:hypothetical protein
MLMMRARAFALRDAFPDVLMGLYLREEFEGVEAETRYAKPELGSGSDTINSRTGSDSKEKYYLRSDSSKKDLEPASYDAPVKTATKSSVRRAPPPPMEMEARTAAPEADDTLVGKGAAEADPQQSEEPAGNNTDSFLNPSDALDLFDSALACAQDQETLEEIREEFNERLDQLDNESLQEAGRIFLRHEKRITLTEQSFADGAKEADDTSDDEDLGPTEEMTGHIGKGLLCPHRRRRFSIRPRKGLTLAELNARRKVDLLKYLPRADTDKDDTDE